MLGICRSKLPDPVPGESHTAAWFVPHESSAVKILAVAAHQFWDRIIFQHLLILLFHGAKLAAVFWHFPPGMVFEHHPLSINFFPAFRRKNYI